MEFVVFAPNYCRQTVAQGRYIGSTALAELCLIDWLALANSLPTRTSGRRSGKHYFISKRYSDLFLSLNKVRISK